MQNVELSSKISTFIDKWRLYIKKYAKSIGLCYTDEDDWIQTARLTFWEVVNKFDENRSCSLDTFVLNMVRLRLIDLKRSESSSWINNCVPLDPKKTEMISPEWRELQIEVSKDSKGILDLIYAGHSITALRRRLGIPEQMIQMAKDEALLEITKGGNMQLRELLIQRLQEFNLPYRDNEDNLTLANRILTKRSTIRSRRYRVVETPDGKPKTGEGKICAATGCGRVAIQGSKFCGLSCAEKSYQALKKRKGTSGVSGLVRTHDELEVLPWQGEESDEGVATLGNPFLESTSAHWVFELLRTGGVKEDLTERLKPVLAEKKIKCSSLLVRIRRVITDTRKLGFEIRKSHGGFFHLTGRRK